MEGRKIGIITFHSAINYGAVLQAYALNKTITKMGYICNTIDYTSKKIKESYNPFAVRNVSDLHTLVDYTCHFFSNRLRERRFRDFVRLNIPLSAYCSSNEEISKVTEEYNILICGSDQVWNYSLTGFDEAYFLNFANEGQIKASYAASFGTDSINDILIEKIENLLNDFSIITVREESAMNILASKIKKEVIIAPDPVFLLSQVEFNEIAKHAKEKGKGKYTLLFLLHKNESLIRFAEELARKAGTQLITLTNSIRKYGTCKKIRGCGPVEFISYIKNAEYIVTDSYHASAISLILNKELYIGLKSQELSSLNTRIDSLVLKYNISDRIIRDNMTGISKIDYSAINKIIYDEREKGISILHRILGITNDDNK